MKFEEVEVGMTVVKARRYSKNEYCKFGGGSNRVPIQTRGTVTGKSKKRVGVNFRNGVYWHVSASELDPAKTKENMALLKSKRPPGINIHEVI